MFLYFRKNIIKTLNYRCFYVSNRYFLLLAFLFYVTVIIVHTHL